MAVKLATAARVGELNRLANAAMKSGCRERGIGDRLPAPTQGDVPDDAPNFRLWMAPALALCLAAPTGINPAHADDLTADLEAFRAQYELPAIAAAVVKDGNAGRHRRHRRARAGHGCEGHHRRSLSSRLRHQGHDGDARRHAGRGRQAHLDDDRR